MPRYPHACSFGRPQKAAAAEVCRRSKRLTGDGGGPGQADYCREATYQTVAAYLLVSSLGKLLAAIPAKPEVAQKVPNTCRTLVAQELLRVSRPWPKLADVAPTCQSWPQFGQVPPKLASIWPNWSISFFAQTRPIFDQHRAWSAPAARSRTTSPCPAPRALARTCSWGWCRAPGDRVAAFGVHQRGSGRAPASQLRPCPAPPRRARRCAPAGRGAAGRALAPVPALRDRCAPPAFRRLT